MKFEPPVIIAPRGSPTFSFEEPQQLFAWAEAERSAWDRWGDGLDAPLSGWRDEVVNIPREIADLCKLLGNSETTRTERLVSRIRARVALYEKGPGIYSRSPEGRRILSLIDEGKHIQAAILAGFEINGRQLKIVVDGLGPVDAVPLLSSVLAKADFDEENQNRREASLQSINGTIKTLQCQFDELIADCNGKFSEISDGFQEAVSANKNEYDRLQNRIKSLETRRASLWKAIKESIRNARSEQKALQLTYESLLTLQAPAGYWSSRARQNRGLAKLSFGGFCLACVVLFGLLYWYWTPLKTALSGHEGKIEIGAAILLAPFVVMVMWLLRMVAKIFGTGLTESVDAEQREVMVQTFLALSKDPATKMTDAERLLIFQALFRSSNSKPDDDNLPTSFWEAALKAAQGGKA